MAELQRKVDAGNAWAMHNLGVRHRDGSKGLEKDLKKAFTLYKRAAEGGDAAGQCAYARAYLQGMGVEKDQSRGLVMLGQAMQMGSDHACYVLGWAFQHGRYGMKRDPAEALVWYKKLLATKEDHCSQATRDKAAEFVREHSQ